MADFIRTMKRVFSYARPYIIWFWLTIIFAAGSVSLSLAVPIFIGDAVDCCVGQGSVDFGELRKIIFRLLIAVVLSALFQWLMSLCTNRLAFRTVRDLRSDVFGKLQRVPLSYIDRSTKGGLSSRVINDIEIISDGLLQGFTQFFSGVITILGTLIFMLTINVKIALVVVLLTPLSFIAASQITKMTHRFYLRQSELRGRMVSFSEEYAGNQKLVTAMDFCDRAVGQFAQVNSDFSSVGANATFFSSLANPVTRFVNGLIYAAVGLLGALGAAGHSAFIGAMSVGRLSSFLAYSNQYTKPFNEISGVFAELQNAAASAERVFAVLDEEEIPDDSDKLSVNSSDCSGSVSFDDISFSYSPETRLIEHLSLDVLPGQRVAIVGPTGCGKSTMINLLLRFYDPQSGKILLSGRDSTEITRDSLRSCFGMVLQETWIFTGTVAQNISYGKPDATREEIIAAAKAVHAHGFIKRLPNGYDSVISEDSGLSQGQKQLLCIARVMLMDPPMLILDEATSSIDLRTEQRIQRAFEKLMTGKTSFVIAHRLSTIKNSDVILVMRDGNIVEKGSHAELMAKNGFYSELYNSQFAS